MSTAGRVNTVDKGVLAGAGPIPCAKMPTIVRRLRAWISGASVTSWLALTAILSGAAALRIWGWDYGIPHPVARPDEEIVLEAVFQMFARGGAEPITFAYPSLAIYLDVLILKGYFAWGQLTGHYDRMMDMLLDIVVFRPGLHYRLARIASVVFGVGTVAATYALGRRVHASKRVGLLASLLVATCLLHVIHSRFATVDGITTFFVTVALVLAVKAVQDQKLTSFLAAGLFAGLSTAVKYNAVFVCLAVAVPALWAARGLERRERFSLGGKLVASGLVAFAAFAVTSPYSLLRFGEVRVAMAHLSGILHAPTGELALWTHLRDTFPLGLGWPFYLAAILGFARAIWSRRPAELAMLGFAVPFYLSMAGVRLTYPRYVVPLVPVLAVWAAGLVVTLSSRRSKLLALPIAAILVAPGVYGSVRFDRLAAERDSRLLATDWIGEHVRRRSKIAVCRGYGAPRINSDRRKPPAFEPVEIPCSADAIRDSGASYVVSHEYPPLGQALSAETSKILHERGRVAASFDPFREGATEEPFFYRADTFYLPISGFSALTRGGPIVTIWELDGRSASGGGE